MTAKLEQNKKSGVYYAQTIAGLELPVIDITHSAFAVTEPDEMELAALVKKSTEQQEKFNRMPALLRKVFLWVFSRKSILMQGLLGASGTYLSGMNTYLLKLGPDNLGIHYSRPLDRIIAASLPALLTRLRLQDMARMTVDAIEPVLHDHIGKPLYLVNIAGGPCADTLNVLILLRAEKPELFANRTIKICVMDLEQAAPTFAARALNVLQSPGAPLKGLNISFEYVPYNWHETQVLQDYLSALNVMQGVVVVTAEGGLFDYGTEHDIVTNLKILHALTPEKTVLAGTITPADGPGKILVQTGGAKTVPRTLDEFKDLAFSAGWSVTESKDRLINYVIRLCKAS